MCGRAGVLIMLRSKVRNILSRRAVLSQDGLLFIFAWTALFWSASQGAMISPTKDNDLSLTNALSRVLILDPYPVLWGAMLAIYLVSDVWLHGRGRAWGKKIASWSMVGGFIILPTLAAMIYRQNSAPHLYIHDGAIQVEQAARFFLHGQNPYSVDYTNTPMANWTFHESGLTVNPALYHLPYLPFLWLSTIPMEMFFQSIPGWYDVRLVYLVLLVASLLLILQSRLFRENSYSAAIVLALNPLFVPFFVEGRNDIVVTFWLLAALVLLNGDRFVWACLALALAIASKQTAWFMVPFFAFYVWARNENKSIAARLKLFLPSLVLLSLLIVPFVLWDAGAFWDDTITFQSGAGGELTNYPIKSLGFGSFVVGFHLVAHNTDAFPFASFQLILGVPLLALLLWIQQRAQTLSRVVLNYALFLTFILFFSRTFNDNHLGYLVTWLIFGFLLESNSARAGKPTSQAGTVA